MADVWTDNRRQATTQRPRCDVGISSVDLLRDDGRIRITHLDIAIWVDTDAVSRADNSLLAQAIGDTQTRSELPDTHVHAGILRYSVQSAEVSEIRCRIVAASAEVVARGEWINLITQAVVNGQFMVDLPLVSGIKPIRTLRTVEGLMYWTSFPMDCGRPSKKSAQAL